MSLSLPQVLSLAEIAPAPSGEPRVVTYEVSEQSTPQTGDEKADEGQPPAASATSAQDRAQAIDMLTRKVEEELEGFVAALGLK